MSWFGKKIVLDDGTSMTPDEAPQIAMAAIKGGDHKRAKYIAKQVLQKHLGAFTDQQQMFFGNMFRRCHHLIGVHALDRGARAIAGREEAVELMTDTMICLNLGMVHSKLREQRNETPIFEAADAVFAVWLAALWRCWGKDDAKANEYRDMYHNIVGRIGNDEEARLAREYISVFATLEN